MELPKTHCARFPILDGVQKKPMKRLQFSLRTLLISALILGPLTGWFGPVIIEGLWNLLAEEDPSPTRRMVRIPRPAPVSRPPQALQLFQTQLDAEQEQQILIAMIRDRQEALRDKQRALETLDSRLNLQLQRLNQPFNGLSYDSTD